VASYQVIQVPYISNGPGTPTVIPQRRNSDLPEHILINVRNPVENPELTGAYWKNEVVTADSGYYANLRNSSNRYAEARVEFVKSDERSYWYILYKKGEYWTTHTGLRLGIGRQNLGHDTLTPPPVEHTTPPVEQTPSASQSTLPPPQPQPYEEFLSGGLHHVATLQGSQPLSEDLPVPTTVLSIERAASEGQQIPVDIPPVTANMSQPQQQQNPQTIGRTTTYSNGALSGATLPIFDGNRGGAKNWMRRFKVYRMANKNKEQMVVPEQRVGVALSYIMGPNVNAWVDEQLKELEDKVLTGGYDPSDERLWTEFEAAYNDAFTDLAEQQNAHQRLLNLTMVGGDLNSYIANFNTLAKLAGFPQDEMGTVEMFKKGLNQQLKETIINNYTKKPVTMADWQKEARERQVRWLETVNSRKTLSPTQQRWAAALNVKRQPQHPRQSGHGNNRVIPMDVDVGEFTELSPEEQDKLRRSNACFYCKQVGHVARKCFKKKQAQGGGWSGATGGNRGRGQPQGNRGGWSGATGGNRGRGPSEQRARVTEASDERTSSKPTKEEFKDMVMGWSEDDRTSFLDSVLDFTEGQD